MHDRSAWTRGPDGPIKIKSKTYKNLIEFTRPCVTCQKLFSIYVTPKIAAGEADSNNFGLKNCEDHRRSAVRATDPELEELRIANAVMREELDGLYARIAQYELAPAMKVAAARAKMPWE